MATRRDFFCGINFGRASTYHNNTITIGMKTIKLLLLLLITSPTWAQSKQELASKIDNVTVYYDGARITRTVKTTLQSGTTEVTLKGITKFADVSNLQVKGDGNFTILKVNAVPNYLREKESKTDTEELIKKNKALDVKIQDLNLDRNIYQTERTLITSNMAIKGNDAVLTVPQLREMADFFRLRLTEIDTKIYGIDTETRKINEEKNKNQQQINSLANYKNDMTYDVIVTVSAKASTSANLILYYYTQKAGWFATYDVKVNNVSEPLSLNLRANVMQTSGEDWTNVKLTLSTGSPSINNAKPEIQPWYLNFGSATYSTPVRNNPNPGLTNTSGRITDANTGEAIPGATVMIKGTGIGTATDINGNFVLTLPPNSGMLVVRSVGFESVEMWPTASMNIAVQQSARELSTVVVSESRYESNDYAPAAYKVSEGKKYKEQANTNATTTVVAQPTTYVFEIEEPYTIASNGKPNNVGIKDYNLNAYYEYYCAPKLDKDAFLTARITGWQQFELVDGEANVYFENTYIGKTLLDLTNTQDTLEVSLGRDKSVVVELKKTQEFTKRQTLGINNVEKRAWEITVKNRKKQDINIVVQDRFPISQSSDISVDNVDVAGAEFNKDTGILTWRMKLTPNEEKKVTPQYSVKYPKNRTVYLE